ncbi:NADH-quinone oxidoreductase subunit B [Ornatilinea apprima]|uniref:NADH-quinone oxidoreductase subunit B n=1 Tax=Ornatilinea apprima TaxID=1134406 RepID=A0A0P6XKK1_9CHLR|nr:NADH-quinone oxidoreductase subunit NuoB [Ornatilinea apprima]KPL72056.1 NADH-quinone oxidoreductase subunit B [Ornatilinea apprima]
MIGLFQHLIKISRRRSPWIYRINAGSCNGCDIEVAPCFSPRYDGEQIGALLQGSPKHADILLISGPVTLRTRDMVKEIYEQVPAPKAVIALGSCPASGNVFSGSPTIIGNLESLIPVDLYVPGCPPRPQAILEAIQKAAHLLENGETHSQQEEDQHD